MYRQRSVFLLVLLLLLNTVAGCAAGEVDTPRGDGPYPLTITDDLGREVTISAAPERIVSLAPSNTEILAALGATDRIVGITDHCNYPPGIEDRTRLGGLYDVKHANFEAIVDSQPDLALAIQGHPEVVTRLEELGITVVAIGPGTLEEVLASIELVGEIIGSDQVETVVSGLRQRVADVEAALAGVEDRPVVLFEIWPDPLMVAGPGSFIDDLIHIAGGQNIAFDAGESYPTLSREIVIDRDPAVIITTFSGTLQEAATRPGWQDLAAVREGRVILIDEDMAARPGPRLVDALEFMARAIHPDAFN